jgi:hypothetical protein
LALINPKLGGGDNRLGLGGLLSYYANLKKGKIGWDNDLSLQLSVQKLAQNDAQKNLDVLRLGSKFSHETFNSKLRTALLASFESQLLPTYEGSYLTEGDGMEKRPVLAKFASPLRLVLAPGIDYKPNDHWTFFLSPSALRFIYVADDEIAALGIHGNEREDLDNPLSPFTHSSFQLGANLNATYKNKFWGEKIIYLSKLDLYSNYRHEPQNIDLLWVNDFGVALFKNFSINLLVEAFYDHDVKVIQDRRDLTTSDDDKIGRGTSITEALLVKYNFIF